MTSNRAAAQPLRLRSAHSRLWGHRIQTRLSPQLSGLYCAHVL